MPSKTEGQVKTYYYNHSDELSQHLPAGGARPAKRSKGVGEGRPLALQGAGLPGSGGALGATLYGGRMWIPEEQLPMATNGGGLDTMHGAGAQPPAGWPTLSGTCMAPPPRGPAFGLASGSFGSAMATGLAAAAMPGLPQLSTGGAAQVPTQLGGGAGLMPAPRALLLLLQEQQRQQHQRQGQGQQELAGGQQLPPAIQLSGFAAPGSGAGADLPGWLSGGAPAQAGPEWPNSGVQLYGGGTDQGVSGTAAAQQQAQQQQQWWL